MNPNLTVVLAILAILTPSLIAWIFYWLPRRVRFKVELVYYGEDIAVKVSNRGRTTGLARYGLEAETAGKKRTILINDKGASPFERDSTPRETPGHRPDQISAALIKVGFTKGQKVKLRGIANTSGGKVFRSSRWKKHKHTV